MKRIIKLAIPFGIIMFLGFSIFDYFQINQWESKDFIKNIIVGLVSGIVYAFFMNYAMKGMKKKTVLNLEKGEHIILDSPSNKNYLNMPGWIYLTSQRLAFVPFSEFNNLVPVEINYEKIISVRPKLWFSLVRDGILIEKKSGETLSFNVENQDLWLEAIQEKISK